MILKANSITDADAGETKRRVLFRERTNQHEVTAVRKNVEPPFIRVGPKRAEQRWSAKFDRAKCAVVAESFGLEVTTHSCKSPPCKLLAAYQRLIGNLALYFSEYLKPSRKVMLMGEVASLIDEIPVRVETIKIELTRTAAHSAHVKSHAGVGTCL